MKIPAFFPFILLVLVFQGLTCFSQNLKFKTYLVEDGLSNNSINQLANDPSGAIWIGTWNGLNRFDGNSFTIFYHDPEDAQSLAGNYIYDVQVDDKKRVWVWSETQTLSLFQDAQSFKHYSFQNKIDRISLNSKDQLEVYLANEVYRFDEGLERFTPCDNCVESSSSFQSFVPDDLKNQELWDTEKDGSGNMWYASQKQGLYFLPYDANPSLTHELQHYQSDIFNPYGLKSNEVTSILEDHFGNIWLGLKDGGLSRAIHNSQAIGHLFSHPHKSPELPNETVRALSENFDGTLWIGYYNSGVFYRPPGSQTFKKLPILSSLSSDWSRVRSIFQDHEGRKWIGTYGGIISFKDLESIELLDDRIIDSGFKRVYSFAEDIQKNQLWLGSWNGVYLLNKEKGRLENYSGEEHLQDLNIRNLHFENNTLYICTEKHGLAILKDGKVTFFNKSNGLLDNSVYTLYKEENSDRIWIGTHSGISIWNTKTNEVESITEDNGLLSNFIYGVLSHGPSIWVSTAKGIASIDKKTLEVTSFLPEEGWQSSEFSEGAYFKNNRGQLYFGGINGLNSFHPNNLSTVNKLPKIQLTQLPTGSDQTVSYEILPIGFGLSPSNKILYRVLPEQENWKEVDHTGQIFLANLNEGSHKLEVKNSMDKDSNLVTADFNIEVPWHKKPVLYFFIVVLILGFISWWRIRSAALIRKKLEQKIKERTHIITQQKSDLEIAYQKLEAKNKEVEEQKSRLLILHSKHKNSDFEMEKFSGYLAHKIRKPISELKLALESASYRDPQTKRGIQLQLDSLMETFGELSLSGKSMENSESTSSLTILPDLFHHLNLEMNPSIMQGNIQYHYSENLSRKWVSLDVIRLKLFLQYLFRELLKFLDESSKLEVQVNSTEFDLQIAVRADSQTLLDGLDTLTHYSLYFHSAKEILKGLSGQLDMTANSASVLFQISLPIREVTSEIVNKSIKNWKHLAMANEIPENKKVILLIGKKFEVNGLIKVLEEESFFFVQEDDSDMISSALNTLKIDMLIIYNEKVTENITKIVNASQKAGDRIPILFMYELLSHGLQEKLMDVGINDFIQLPTSKSLINRKIKNILSKNEEMKLPLKMEGILNFDESTINLSPNEKLVKEAIQQIRMNYEKPSFKVETLYEMLGISKIKLYRVFKDILHQAPSDIIIQLRMEKAHELLQKSKMNVSEISFVCGFNDPKHFSKVFKKYYGSSPKKYQSDQELEKESNEHPSS